MKQYLELLQRVLDTGRRVPDRTGVGTTELFGEQLKIDLHEDTFPLLTTRQIFYSGALAELCCFVQGKHQLKDFHEAGCRFWNANATNWHFNQYAKNPEEFSIGRIYGVQWRDFHGIRFSHVDQLKELVKNLEEDPHSRRHILTTWNPAELKLMCLPPCHIIAQFNVQAQRLSCHVYMRSVDLCLGLPSDIVTYAGLTHMLAKLLGFEVGELIFSFGSAHIYNNHKIPVRWQLKREPMEEPKFRFAENFNFWKPTVNMFKIEEYKHHERIDYPFNV